MRADFPTSRRYRSSSFNPMFVIIPIFIIIMICIGIARVSTTGMASNCLVTDKDRASSRSSNESSMRIYTQNCGTFEVHDTLIGKVNFNSADLYASITVGKTYDFTTRGFRAGILSSFPYILTATEV